MSLALLIARMVIGFGLAAHGAQKLFGWYGGYGTKATGEFMASLGWSAGVPMAVIAGFGETAGGLLTAFGFLGPLGPAMIIVIMVTAVLTVHLSNGWFVSKNGMEFPATVAAGALVLAYTGPGSLSLDGLLGLSLPWLADRTGLIVSVAAAAGAGAALARRKR